MTLSGALYRRIFSGIQPTGVPHLGNYYGAISQWIDLAKERQIQLKKGEHVTCDTPIYSIVDVHSYSGQNIIYGQQLYDKILSTTASLLALGLNTNNCILFKQSDVLEHNYLETVLNNFITTNRLYHMTQFKDKSKASGRTAISNALLNYPVLQAADILIYKANLVPIGEDQIQHIELTRDIAKNFNLATKSQLFPEPESSLASSIHSRRIKSLRDPDKKMSKSDPNKKGFIEVIDAPDIIVEKCKKALTDSNSSVYYDAENRPGVSNLMRIYHLSTGESFEQITEQFKSIDTGRFKLRVADVLIAQFSDARNEFARLVKDRAYLEQVLKDGCQKAQSIASRTVTQVKQVLGSIGT